MPNLGTAPTMRAADSFAADRSLQGPTMAIAWPDGEWWRGYRDAQLDRLMAEALAGSPDLAAALARLDEADGFRRQTQALSRPRIDAQVTAAETKQSYDLGVPRQLVPQGWRDAGSATLTGGVDLDLWGRNRANLRAAKLTALAAALDAAQARLVVSTGIGSAYVDLNRLFAERDVQAEAIAVRLDSQRLVARRVANGLDSLAASKQADAALSAERVWLVQIDEAIDLTRHRIAALMGEGPDRGLSIDRPGLSFARRAVPRDVTTDLIGRRPDVASARARVEASGQRIKAARAAFYPSLDLSALVGFESLGLGNLLRAGSTFGQVGPALSLPILHGGELSGRYRVARANYDEAVAGYDGAVAGAFRDVADAVTSSEKLDDQLVHARRSLAESSEAYALARRRYEGGLASYLTVLIAQNAVLETRRTSVDLEARALALDVALVRALGGGAVLPSLLVIGAGNHHEDPFHG